MIKAKKQEIDLDQLREDIIKHKEEGKKIISHFKKLEEYYSDWEDRMNAIENRISEAEDSSGLTKQEITQYDALQDALGS